MAGRLEEGNVHSFDSRLVYWSGRFNIAVDHWGRGLLELWI
jgi:hypothetical protein